MMRVSSRHVSVGLLAIVVALATTDLFALARLNEAMLFAMAPNDPSPGRWRLIGIALLSISLIAALLAFHRVWRHDRRASSLSAIAASLAAIGMFASNRIAGLSYLDIPTVLCVAAALSAGHSAYWGSAGPDVRHEEGMTRVLWLATFLQAGALAFVSALIDERHWERSPLEAMMLTIPQWIVAWRFSSTNKLSRWDAGAATTCGVLGVTELVVMTVLPVGYLGFFGQVLLRTTQGWAFYLSLGLGSWLFLKTGAALRTRLNAPRRDRRLATMAGVVAIPVLATIVAILRVALLAR